MRPLKAFALLLCFFLDVHVRAEALVGPRTTPKLKLDAGALAETRADHAIALVRGSFLLREAGTFTTPFAVFTCAHACTALVERAPDLVTLTNLGGDWQVVRLGDEQAYAVPVATRVSVRPVGLDGKADLEFPQALAWAPTLKVWGRLFPGSAKEFRAQVEAFREVWEEAVEQTSQMQEGVARRAIASAAAAQAAVRANQIARDREDAELRAQFRERNFPSH